MQSRRDFLASASLAAATSALGGRGSLAAEPPPEITTIRLNYWPNYACLAPHSISEALLRAEGFTDVQFVPPTHVNSVARGDVDFDLETAAWVVSQIDAGEPIAAVAGVHVGCYELFVHEPIRTVSDLKGRRVGVDYIGSSGHMYLSIMTAQVGLDPSRDVEWVVNTNGGLIEPFVEGKVDAILAFAPEPQELRARGIGRMILSTAWDLPWSQYFCCMAFGRRHFVREYPVATKRYLRAILKAADLCAAAPAAAARRLVDEGFSDNYEHALQTLIDLPYDRWREYDPADSMRFYALRLHEVGMVQSGPNQIIAEGTDWRFLNELKRELKA